MSTPYGSRPVNQRPFASLARSLSWIAIATTIGGCSGESSDWELTENDLPEQAEFKEDAITGGNLVSQDYFDNNNHAQAVVRIRMEAGGLCSGTKIGPRRFLTAAHCMDTTSSGRPIDITNRLSGRFSGTGAYNNLDIDAIFTHPTWKGNPSLGFDIAIFDVAEDTPEIPAFAGELFDHRYIPDGAWGRLLGYGCDAVSNNDGQKQWGDFQAWSRSSSPAGAAYDSLYAHNITSYTPGIQGCSGDSGGPFIQERGRWRIIGVISSGDLSVGRTNFVRVDELSGFLRDPANTVRQACVTDCNRACTRNVSSGSHTDGVGECIQSCSDRCD